MSTAIIQLAAVKCPACLQKIGQAVWALPGIQATNSRVLVNSNKLRISFDASQLDLETVKRVIENLGYAVLYSKVRYNEGS